jgi:hypothetical protein
VRVDPVFGAGAAAIVSLAVTYLAFGGKFPFTRTPVRFVLAYLLAFVVGFAVLAALVTTQP